MKLIWILLIVIMIGCANQSKLAECETSLEQYKMQLANCEDKPDNMMATSDICANKDDCIAFETEYYVYETGCGNEHYYYADVVSAGADECSDKGGYVIDFEYKGCKNNGEIMSGIVACVIEG